MWIYIALILFLILFISLLFVFFNMAFVRKNNVGLGDVETSNYLKPYLEQLRPGIDFIDNHPCEEVSILSYDGLKLYGRYYDHNTDKTIILVHGYRSNGKHDFSGALKFYYDFGFNVLLIDQRSHGKSEGRLITFGVKESFDVRDWAEFLNKKYSPKSIVLSGVSMGGGTVVFALKRDLPQNVKCVIADCGFTSPEAIIRKVGKDRFKINAKFYMPFLNAMTHIFGGFSIYESTIDALKDNKIPVMFIHGEKDTFVPVEMSREALKAAGEYGSSIFVKEADHGLSYLVETERVVSETSEFLTKNLA
ncbi:MAG: alpha/beta hydrolase [Clostridia bacterium]|nr:alpha/beta hydrolase [Clostridia bacterium]